MLSLGILVGMLFGTLVIIVGGEVDILVFGANVNIFCNDKQLITLCMHNKNKKKHNKL